MDHPWKEKTKTNMKGMQAWTCWILKSIQAVRTVEYLIIIFDQSNVSINVAKVENGQFISQ